MDPSHSAVVAEPTDRQLASGSAEETGGVPHVPPQAQAPTCRAESQAGDQLQHPSDQTASVQQACLHAHRRKNGVGTYST